jgi:IS5 family transposase
MEKHIPAYARFQWLNHPLLRTTLSPFFRYAGTGRRGHDKVEMVLWLMYKQLMRCSYRDLESMSGIDHTTFIKFRSRLKKNAWFPKLFETLVQAVLAHRNILNLILDSSFVETYSKHDEEGSGYSGYKEKNGYKTHEIIDWKTRLPLFQVVTPGNVADITAGEMLVERAPPDLRVKSFAADKGYDSEYFVHRIAGKWKTVRVAIPVRRKQGDDGRNRAGRSSERSTDPVLYRKRTEIERHFSRKKRVFHLGEERNRTLENFRANAYLTSSMQILEWLVKQKVTTA